MGQTQVDVFIILLPNMGPVQRENDVGKKETIRCRERENGQKQYKDMEKETDFMKTNPDLLGCIKSSSSVSPPPLRYLF